MFDSLYERFSAIWNRLNIREKRLAVLTAAAILLFLSVTVTQQAMGRLKLLDNQAFQLQTDILNYKQQMIHKELVERQYAKVAAQHSSKWTEAEIHDRLRGEIYRLARQTPQALDKYGIPENTPNEDGNLVEIPSLGKGTMSEGGEGYRQYTLPLRIPQATMPALVSFLERLQLSPQSLRIDKLEITRMPESSTITANIAITRTIANNVVRESENADDGGNVGGEAEEGRLSVDAPRWSTRACEVTMEEGAEGKPVATLHPKGEGAVADLLRLMVASASYELYVDAICTGKAELSVALEGAEKPFPEAVEMKGDGSLCRYQLQFTVPDNAKALACPRISFNDPDTTVAVHALLLRRLSE